VQLITSKFTFSAGIFIRRQFRRVIQQWCFELNLQLDMSELKGWSGSDFLIAVEGKQVDIDTLIRRLKYIEDEQESD
jgi:hypothetical protein